MQILKEFWSHCCEPLKVIDWIAMLKTIAWTGIPILAQKAWGMESVIFLFIPVELFWTLVLAAWMFKIYEGFQK